METRYEDIFPLKLLPDLALDIIAQFLIPSDLVSLSQSCTRFVYLRKYLPEFQDISGDNFKDKLGEVVTKLYKISHTTYADMPRGVIKVRKTRAINSFSQMIIKFVPSPQ